MTTRAQIDRFLAGQRIGFAGVSTDPKHFSRMVMRELESRGYDVVPIHPTAVLIADRTAYHHVYDVPGRLDGVLIMTPRASTADIVAQCLTAGVPRVWMHRGAGAGAVDHGAATHARARGIDVIEGECPMMFLPDGDAVHQAHAVIRHAFGHYPDDAALRDRAAPVFAVAYGVIAWSLCTLLWMLLAVPLALSAPFVFAGVAWLHAQRAANLPAITAAAVLVGVTLVLDLIFLGFPWPSLVLAFVGAAAGGIRRPFRAPDLHAGAAA